MKELLILLGCVLCLLITLPSVNGEEDEELTDEQATEEWNQFIDQYNETFPNNDELKLLVTLTKDEQYYDFKDALITLNGSYDFGAFLESLKTKYPSISAQLQPLYEKKLAAYQSLGEVERKLLDGLFVTLKRNLFDHYRLAESLGLETEEARKWKKAFGALSDQQKDAIRSKFPLLTYFVRQSGKVEDMEAQLTESELSSIIDDEARTGLFYEIVNEANNSTDYKKWMVILKGRNETIYNEVKPLVEKLEKAYNGLSKEPKAFILQGFEWMFGNRRAFKEDTYDNYLTDDQVKQLKKKYYSLPKDEQSLVETSFPHFIGNLKYYFELSIAKAFNKNR